MDGLMPFHQSVLVSQYKNVQFRFDSFGILFSFLSCLGFIFLLRIILKLDFLVLDQQRFF